MYPSGESSGITHRLPEPNACTGSPGFHAPECGEYGVSVNPMASKRRDACARSRTAMPTWLMLSMSREVI
jgi:hypothetical protein